MSYGLGQDFNFKFSVNTGIRYDINDAWFIRLMAEYAHFPNAGLSEPARQNRAIDAAGPQPSVGCRFWRQLRYSDSTHTRLPRGNGRRNPD